MKAKKRSEKYIARLEAHKALSESRAEYAMKRLDVLILALAGSGIYFGFEFLEKSDNYGIVCVIIALIIFLLSILTNVISQWYGYLSNSSGAEWAELEISKEKLTKKKEKEEAERDADAMAVKSDNYGNKTSLLNKGATGLLIAGLAFLCVVVISWVCSDY